jgi:hypothetical protein
MHTAVYTLLLTLLLLLLLLLGKCPNAAAAAAAAAAGRIGMLLCRGCRALALTLSLQNRSSRQTWVRRMCSI